MSKFDSKKVMPRYSFLAILMTLVAITVVGKTLYIMTAKRAFWEEVADRVKVDSLKTLPIRGNILSCDGQLMASSLPQYNIFMDFVALREAKKDTLFEQKLDSICMGLNAIFPDRSAEEFKKHLMEGFEKNKRHWPVWNRRINYSTFSEVKSLPVFNLSKNQSGFHWDEHNARKLAYGSLAGRTIGKMYGAKDTAQCGLELSYDSLLRGEEGIRHRRKVLNKYLDIVDTPPGEWCRHRDYHRRVDARPCRTCTAQGAAPHQRQRGCGYRYGGEDGRRKGNRQYDEVCRRRLSRDKEPRHQRLARAWFGVQDSKYHGGTRRRSGRHNLSCGDSGGVWPMYGREMKDHNWRRGGYGMLTLPQTLMVSSNIGVSRIIDDHYHNTPEKFVQGIYRLGLADDLHIPLQGASPHAYVCRRKTRAASSTSTGARQRSLG